MTSLTECVASLAFPIHGTKELKRCAERFLHNHPEDVRSWILLAAALNADAVFCGDVNNTRVTQFTDLALKKGQPLVTI